MQNNCQNCGQSWMEDELHSTLELHFVYSEYHLKRKWPSQKNNRVDPHPPAWFPSFCSKGWTRVSPLAHKRVTAGVHRSAPWVIAERCTLYRWATPPPPSIYGWGSFIYDTYKHAQVGKVNWTQTFVNLLYMIEIRKVTSVNPSQFVV